MARHRASPLRRRSSARCAVAENLSEEDMQLLASRLKPELWGPLAARLEKFHKDKKAKQEETDRTLRLVANNADPEADAAGD